MGLFNPTTVEANPIQQFYPTYKYISYFCFSDNLVPTSGRDYRIKIRKNTLIPMIRTLKGHKSLNAFLSRDMQIIITSCKDVQHAGYEYKL